VGGSATIHRAGQCLAAAVGIALGGGVAQLAFSIFIVFFCFEAAFRWGND